MTAQNPTPQPIHFQGAATSSLDTMLQNSTRIHRWLGKVLKVQEGDNGLSHVTFMQDTLVALIPKIMVSRSTAEITESSFLELMESALLYYALPFVGDKAFKPLFNNIANINKLGLTTAEKDARILGARAATILATFGTVLVGGEFATNYLKNMMTAKIYHKDSFSDVVNLSQGKMKSDKNSPMMQKSKTRLKQCLMACGGILAGSFLLAKGTGRSKILEGIAGKFTKYLDFGKKADGGLRLGQNQLVAYMALSIFAYLDSARDKLERVETASRLMMIVPYLSWGQGWLQDKMLHSKWGSNWFKNVIDETTKQPLTLRELARKEVNRYPGDTKKAAIEFADPLRRKAAMAGIPLAFGIFVTGIGVGLLNRFWTKYRFQKHEQAEQLAESPVRQTTTFSNFGVNRAMPFNSTSMGVSIPQYASPLPFANQTFQQPNFNYANPAFISKPPSYYNYPTSFGKV